MDSFPRSLLLFSRRNKPIRTNYVIALSLTLITSIAFFYFYFLARESNVVLSLSYDDVSGNSQDNYELIAYIKQLHIHSPLGSPYNLQKPQVKDPSQNGQGVFIANVFHGKIGGTFLEAGAYNGEDYSNTLYLEREMKWTGLLVEPDPWNFWVLRKKARNAHSIQCCLSPFPSSKEVSFKQSDTMGHINEDGKKETKGIFTRVKCFPLYSLLLAQNLTTLDLLSLDIEGQELQVLKTIPWHKVNISVILIEVSHVPEGKDYVQKFLERKGYRLETSLGEDYIFVHRNMNKA